MSQQASLYTRQSKVINALLHFLDCTLCQSAPFGSDCLAASSPTYFNRRHPPDKQREQTKHLFHLQALRSTESRIDIIRFFQIIYITVSTEDPNIGWLLSYCNNHCSNLGSISRLLLRPEEESYSNEALSKTTSVSMMIYFCHPNYHSTPPACLLALLANASSRGIFS